jgi:hypothetical protein
MSCDQLVGDTNEAQSKGINVAFLIKILRKQRQQQLARRQIWRPTNISFAVFDFLISSTYSGRPLSQQIRL